MPVLQLALSWGVAYRNIFAISPTALISNNTFVLNKIFFLHWPAALYPGRDSRPNDWIASCVWEALREQYQRIVCSPAINYLIDVKINKVCTFQNWVTPTKKVFSSRALGLFHFHFLLGSVWTPLKHGVESSLKSWRKHCGHFLKLC